MDEELQNLRRDVIARQPSAAAKLDTWLDRAEGLRPGVVKRIFDPRTADIVVLLVDASMGPVMISLPQRTPGMFDPIWVKKMDPSDNPVTIRAPQGTSFEGGAQVWVVPVVSLFQSEGPFALHGVTWVRI